MTSKKYRKLNHKYIERATIDPPTPYQVTDPSIDMKITRQKKRDSSSGLREWNVRS